MDNPEKIFQETGGQFITPYKILKEKAAEIKAAVFDWDGVFNDGTKYNDEGSPFSEPDSMGLNMFRLNHWLMENQIPQIFIITGKNNRSAVKFSEREKINAVFLNYIYKPDALDIICEQYGLKKEEIVFVFDDILDFEVARQAGISFLVQRKAGPLTTNFAISNNICDYVTGNPGGNFAVREACELLIGMTGNMTKTIETRIRFKGDYEKYLFERNRIETKIFNNKY